MKSVKTRAERGKTYLFFHLLFRDPEALKRGGRIIGERGNERLESKGVHDNPI
jgi:hypothetical protein